MYHDEHDHHDRKCCEELKEILRRMENADRECCRVLSMQQHKTNNLLQEILLQLYEINARLKPSFTSRIIQIGGNMSVPQGGTGSFQFQVSASDSSVVTLSSVAFTADDPNVQIGPVDANNTVVVTVPPSDTATSFNLSATGQATSTTVSTPQSVQASTSVTIVPSTVPVTFTAQIVQTA